MGKKSLLVLLLYLSTLQAVTVVTAFIISGISTHTRRKSPTILAAEINSYEDGTTTTSSSSFSLPDAYTQRKISKIFGTCIPLSLIGRCNSSPNDVDILFLSSIEEGRIISNAYTQLLQSSDKTMPEGISFSALPIPLSPSLSSSAMKLLSHSYTSDKLSKSVLLSLNSLLVNRDGGLFDNIPWSTWSIDPDLKERDAANNVVDSRFSFGKRVAYQRFMGKDWQGRSLSLTNLAKRLRYMLERSDSKEEDDIESNDDDAMMLSLSQRLLELEVTEATMSIADCEKNLAIAKTSQNDNKLEIEQLEKARVRLKLAETSLNELNENNNRSETPSLILSILDKLAEQANPPPYRGAIGYPAKVDTKDEMFEDSFLPYSSPYDLLKEIISEQLNAEVIGCILEQSSLLEGNLVLGGALLLKRKGVEKSTALAGETVSYSDDDDDFGNLGVLPRSMYVVECFSDEAIGFAMTSRMPVWVRSETYEQAATMDAQLDVKQALVIRNETKNGIQSLSYSDRIPLIRLFDDIAELATQMEGDRVLKSQSRFPRIPLSTNPTIFDGPNQVPSLESSGPVFSTFNPVASLDEYDMLYDDDKVRLLLKLESFKGPLPRPRAVTSDPSLLDQILLPLIDESVRRQHQIRDAERRGDFEEANALRSEMSPRQQLLEEAQRAREAGLEERALQLEQEAEIYKGLRADVTQDEGAYSRFLDRDDWYERETQARINRLDKKKFGSLLDGIDLP